MESILKPLAAASCLIVFLTLLVNSSKSRYPVPLPPGPPGEPIIGHLRVVPKENTAAVFAKWAREFKSDLIHVNTLGQSVVVLNSREAARRLLDQRGRNYSDRPRFVLLEVMGWGRTISFMPYGKLWQMHRKLLQTEFSNSSVRKWQDLQTTEARRTAKDLLKGPEGWEDSLRRFAVAIVLKVSYGVDVTDDNDPYVRIANDAMHALGNGGAPGNSIVDYFPPARYLPSWLVPDWPLQFARDWRWAIEKLHNVPFSKALEAMANKLDNECLAHSLLRQHRDDDERKPIAQNWSLEDIKGVAGAVFIAGADTTWATCTIFVLNMVRHPGIQTKAQNLLDSVVGRGRLPEFADREKLPYINFIVQELYRWAPLAPLGIPHKSIEDDVYDGMFIPAGSTVYANVQAMSRDPRIYRDPDDFNPNRYESVERGGFGEPPPVGHFGFGRRICVGRHLADNSVWMMVATMLATLDIRGTGGSERDGVDKHPTKTTPEFTNGGTCHPQYFQCRIAPRPPMDLV